MWRALLGAWRVRQAYPTRPACGHRRALRGGRPRSQREGPTVRGGTFLPLYVRSRSSIHPLSRAPESFAPESVTPESVTPEQEQQPARASRSFGGRGFGSLTVRLSTDRRTVLVMYELAGNERAGDGGDPRRALNTVYSRLRLARADFERAVAEGGSDESELPALGRAAAELLAAERTAARRPGSGARDVALGAAKARVRARVEASLLSGVGSASAVGSGASVSDALRAATRIARLALRPGCRAVTRRRGREGVALDDELPIMRAWCDSHLAFPSFCDQAGRERQG